MINISELITDPDFSQPNGIKIIRTKLSIENFSQVKVEEEMVVPGIITISSEVLDSMGEQFDSNSEYINVFTLVRLYTTGNVSGEQYLSDVVVWNGQKYKVEKVLNDLQYGFCRATASRIEMGDI